MPKKIRELIRSLEKAGFINRGGKGSHRNFVYSPGIKVTLSGHPSKDARRYQEKEIKTKIEEAKNEIK